MGNIVLRKPQEHNYKYLPLCLYLIQNQTMVQVFFEEKQKN